MGSVYIIASWCLAQGKEPTIAVAAAGLAIGELSSMLLALPAAYLHFIRKAYPAGRLPSGTIYRKASGTSPARLALVYGKLSRQIIGFAAPLSANRLCLNLLQAIEAACIPAKLQVYGHTVSDSLSVYGVLTGMALPLIYFPGTLTNSVSVLLMPAISEADAVNNQNAIRQAVRKCLGYCLLLGCVCCIGFLAVGKTVGLMLYNSEMAGHFIIILSFMCPFLYLNTTLTSILHGLGKTSYSFFLSLTSLMLRLVFVFQAIPLYGIKGYLAGMLLSQLYTTICCLLPLRQYLLPG